MGVLMRIGRFPPRATHGVKTFEGVPPHWRRPTPGLARSISARHRRRDKRKRDAMLSPPVTAHSAPCSMYPLELSAGEAVGAIRQLGAGIN